MESKDFDRFVNTLSESVVRKMQRRKILIAGIKGVFAATAGIALANFEGIKNAFAVTCTCAWAFGGQCYGTGSEEQNCPSGCTTCTLQDYCNGWCNYQSGYWTSCSGLGQCGHGYRICKDCKCPNCSNVCTILSNILCYGCCTAQQVEAEMRRLAAGLANPDQQVPSVTP